MFELYDVNYEDTEPFIPPITHGKVIKVYDGDTITIAAMLPYKDSILYRFSVRINGIDCPEIRTKDKDEKKCAIMAKGLIMEKAMNKIVSLENLQTEKYGRILADVICDGESLGDLLLNARLAIKYDGGKKSPTNWIKYYTHGDIKLNESPKKVPFYKKILNNIVSNRIKNKK
jgi:micrococcal nuclease|uniref:TNase-like domain-containing protein n=1 Tax=viral metagenome TaxID=1070528 RepID=A0A6C0IMN6_9ZZZZ